MCSELYLNYDKPKYTHWHHVKPREKDDIFMSCPEKYEQPYWFPICKITSGCRFYSWSYQSQCESENFLIQPQGLVTIFSIPRLLYYYYWSIIFRVRFENQYILCNPDPKNNQLVTNQIPRRNSASYWHVNMMEGSPTDCKFCEALL